MKGGKPVVNPFGFTIVEVMIVLVVTLVIFAGAVTAISGRTQTAEFTQEVNEVQSNFQALMNDVATGNYNTAQNFYCYVTAPKGTIQTNLSNTADTGACVRLGQALLFTQGNTYYEVVVLGATQDIDGSGGLSANYAQAQPTIPNNSYIAGTIVTSVSLENELVAKWADYSTTAGQPLYSSSNPKTDMVAFLDDPAAAGTTVSIVPTTSSGAVGVNVIPVPDNGYPLPTSFTTVASALTYAATAVNFPSVNNNHTSLAETADGTSSFGNIKNPPGGVGICFASQSTNQSVLYTFGGSNRSTAIENQIFSGKNC